MTEPQVPDGQLIGERLIDLGPGTIDAGGILRAPALTEGLAQTPAPSGETSGSPAQGPRSAMAVTTTQALTRCRPDN
jgi:hypothetical protein